MYQRVGKAAYKEGLENTYKLDDYFRSPHRNYATIHVAGTNGKGSVCHMLASVLQHAGYKTGLHTSPHLLDFRERFRVNGQMMNEDFVTVFVNDHKDFFDRIKPSFFEMSVFMAFEYFLREQVDIAIIEVGLGGRLDSTNIISPELSVVTNIGLDHTEFLGNSLAIIASEKGGIIKNETPVVIGEKQKETQPVFERIASQKKAPLYYAQDSYESIYSTLSANGKQLIRIINRLSSEQLSLETDLLGLYQKKNTVTCLKSLDILKDRGWQIQKNAVEKGLNTVKSSTGLMGRWQICGNNPLIVCDTAHNYEGLTEVTEQIRHTPFHKLHMVMGFVVEKDLSRIMKILPADATYYFLRPSVPRGLDSNKLLDIAAQSGLKGNAYDHISSAMEEVRKNAGIDDLVFIGGSTFLVADFLKFNAGSL